MYLKKSSSVAVITAMITNKHSASATGASLLLASIVKADCMTWSQKFKAKLGRVLVSEEYKPNNNLF